MVIVLSTPFGVGDLAPGTTYPHVYITTLYLNGPQMTMQITYEYGTYDGQWNTAPLVPAQTLSLGAADLLPFFSTLPTDTTTPLWNAVEALMYEQVQATDARTAGSIQGVA